MQVLLVIYWPVESVLLTEIQCLRRNRRSSRFVPLKVGSTPYVYNTLRDSASKVSGLWILCTSLYLNLRKGREWRFWRPAVSLLAASIVAYLCHGFYQTPRKRLLAQSTRSFACLSATEQFRILLIKAKKEFESVILVKEGWRLDLKDA